MDGSFVTRYFDDVSKRYLEIIDVVNAMTFSDNDVIVLDIDETILCTLCDSKQVADFFKLEKPEPARDDRKCPPIPNSIAFVKALQKTARREALRYSTIELLKPYEPYNTIRMRPLHYHGSTANFKSEQRREISKVWNIKVCIGDQKIDIDDYTEHGFLIPNPFYTYSN